jgi:hypothetical protein
MEIKTEDYSIFYNLSTATIICQGSLRLNGMEEYAAILQLLYEAVEREPAELTLDLQNLKFLNSSGISMLSKFVIEVRKKRNIQVVAIGSKEIPWQSKSLKNLQRLMPSLKLEFLQE